MNKYRVAVFIDGLNLHHSLDELKKDHLKWLDLKKLTKEFAPESHFEIGPVFFFSAYATWIYKEHQRHKAYVEALQSTGVIPVLGHFVKKNASCKCCSTQWIRHEEKESDVNMALYILNEAYKDSYDTALIISADADLAPAIRMAKDAFPEKRFKILTPPTKNHCLNLVAASNLKPAHIQEIHLERSLLPSFLVSSEGVTIDRPDKFEPPEDCDETESPGF